MTSPGQNATASSAVPSKTASMVVEEITAFSKLADNWDGEGGRAPVGQTIETACIFLGRLELDGLPLPEVFAVGDGEIGLTWTSSSERIDVSFFEDGEIAIHGSCDGVPIRELGHLDSLPMLHLRETLLRMSYSAVRTAIGMMLKGDAGEALAIDEPTKKAAIHALERAEKRGLPAPQVYPDGQGGVVCTWARSSQGESTRFLTVDEKYTGLFRLEAGGVKLCEGVIDNNDKEGLEELFFSVELGNELQSPSSRMSP